jgi:hypothetical protein
MKVLDFNWSRVTCLFRLSFHVVGKRVCLVMLWQNPTRRDKTWNYIPLKISEVHQTYPGHMISIWACRECLGHSISKKNKVKRCFFGWVISRVSFLTPDWLQQIDHTTSWHWLQIHLQVDGWLQVGFRFYWPTNWLQVGFQAEPKLITHWIQLDWDADVYNGMDLL